MDKIDNENNIKKEYGGDIFTLNIPIKKVDIEKKTNIFFKLFAGAFIGFVNGFWGGGGGMLCVPLLINFIKLPEKKAHATTLLIMLPLSIASLIVYYLSENLPIFDAIKIGFGFVIGGILGALLLKKISNIWLDILFSVIIIAGGVKLLI